MNNEITSQVNETVTPKKKCGAFRKLAFAVSAMSAMSVVTATTALAGGGAGGAGGAGGGGGSTFGEDVTISGSADLDAADMMGKIIGILLTITRFVGIALIVYGIYEIVMSFMQNQPEAKTKGIIMALAGVVMTALKSILQSLGVVS